MKLKRYRCSNCNRLKVSWKLIGFGVTTTRPKFLFCRPCCKSIKEKLSLFDLNIEPDKKMLLKQGNLVKSKQRELTPDFGN